LTCQYCNTAHDIGESTHCLIFPGSPVSIAPILTRARAALDGGAPAEALDLLLTAWRTQRRSRLNPLIAALSRHLESADACSLRTTLKNKTHGAWLKLATQCSEADRGALIDTLTQGTISEAKKRLKIVEGWSADPRIATEVLRWPLALPFVSTSSQPAWNSAFRSLTTSTDPEALATIKRLSHTGIRSGGSMQDWMASSLPRLAKKMAKATIAVPDDASAEAQLEALRVTIVALTSTDIAAPLAPPEVRLAATLASLPAAAPAPLTTTLQAHAALAPSVNEVAWSGDGSRSIARITDLLDLTVVFSEEGAPLQLLPGAESMAVSSDGTRILLASGDLLRLYADDGTLLASHTPSFPLTPEHRGVWQARTAAAHPERSDFAVAFTTKERLCVGLLVGADLTPVWLLSRPIKSRLDWSTHLAFSPSGRFLYGGPAPLMVYDLEWKMFRQLAEGHTSNTTAMIALPGDHLGLLHSHRAPEVIDACSGWSPTPQPDVTDHVLAQTQQEQRIAALAPLPALCGVTGSTEPIGWIGSQLLHLHDGALVPLGDLLPAAIRCALSVDSMVLIGLTTRYDRMGSIHVRSQLNGAQVATMEGHTRTVQSIAASPDRIATGAKDNSVRLWSRQWTEECRLDGHSDGVSALAFSADGALLASGGGDGLRIWEVSCGLELVAVAIEDDIFAVGWVGAVVVVAAGSAVCCWDGTTLTATPLPAAIRYAAVRPGDVLVAACEDGTLWSVRPGAPPERLLDGFLRPPPIAFGTDGRLHIGGGHPQQHGALLSLGAP
jgi:hypothetical protein